MFSSASQYGFDSASGFPLVSASVAPSAHMRYFLVKFLRKSRNETNESSSDTVVPQTRLWLDPPRASASDVCGLLFANEAASDPRAEPSRTTRPASSRMMRRGMRGVRTKSGFTSPRWDLKMADLCELTKSALLSLRRSDCWLKWRPGLELGS